MTKLILRCGSIFGILVFLLPLQSSAANGARIQDFLYLSAGELRSAQPLLRKREIAGVQVVYPWKLLEPKKGHYDFSAIEGDLALARSAHKKLFIQIQDRFFTPEARNVPDYLLTEREFDGGLAAQIDRPGESKAPVAGWVAQQWNARVRARYQALLTALAFQFDGQVYGINLPETSADLDKRRGNHGFQCDSYFQAELENIAFARRVFRQSYVVQYANFWPCEWDNNRRYMSRLFASAAANGIGLGGPDIVPYNKAQMHNSYPFFHRYRGMLSLIAMAVQEPTLTYHNPATGKPFTRNEIESFARDFLGADVIFWSPSAPWLRN